MDEKIIVDYLLGVLPEGESEHLDEMSVVDPEFADRLLAVENDLVDSYVRGEMSTQQMEQFKTHFLKSNKRREKVRFAETFQTAMAQRDIPATVSFTRNQPRWQWSIAAAAIVLMLIAGFLLLENNRLRNEISSQVAQQQPKENEKITSLELLPQTRGVSEAPAISIPSGTTALLITLNLDSNDFPGYAAALKSLDDQVIWQTTNLKADGTGQKMQVKIPVNLLSAQHYILELSGFSSADAAELVGTYAFRVSSINKN